MAEQDYNQQWLAAADEYSAPLEDWQKVPVVGEDGIDNTMSVPGVAYSADPTITSNAKPLNFVQLHLGSLFRRINSMEDGLVTAKTNAETATTNANAATANANTAAAGASNVNATLSGMTVTITNRQGESSSVNIGFEVYRTYTSVAAMNADAARVPTGKFVMIATTDPTSPENARLYCRNDQPSTSSTPFTFLSDLDQASAEAWADWLNNMKPQIESAIDTADTDHTRANTDHATATTDHTTATADHTQATTDHNTATQDHTTATSDHSKAVTDHTQAGADHTQAQTDHTRATTDHNTASTDHSIAVTDHNTATSDHTRAESDHTRAESDHSTAVQDHSTATSDHAISAQQQSTFEADEAQRQQDFEDAEAERMAAMVITRCIVDFETMHLLFVQPEADTTQYRVRNGNLNVTITYDD